MTMKQLRLVLKDKWCQTIDWLSVRQNTEDFTKKYFSLRISEANHINQETVEIMSKHVELHQLEFNDCVLSLEHCEILTHIMQELNKLEVLKFHETFIVVHSLDEFRIKDVQMPNLKTVVLYNSSPAVSWKYFFEFWLRRVHF